MANNAVFTIDGIEVRIDRDDDGEASLMLSTAGYHWTAEEWRVFAAKVQTAVDAASPIVKADG